MNLMNNFWSENWQKPAHIFELSASGGQRVGLFKRNLARHNLTVLQKSNFIHSGTTTRNN